VPYNTSVVARIRTVDNKEVYSKLYPYPVGVSEVAQVLKDGIIRPSRSAYNSPAWIVDKKGIDSNGKKNKRRGQIGKICYDYVDDVTIFSENAADHVRHIDIILQQLCNANMRVRKEKTKFFKESIEYLGFLVTSGEATTEPGKVKAI